MSFSLSFSVYGVEYGPFYPKSSRFGPYFEIDAPFAYEFPLKFSYNPLNLITITSPVDNRRYYFQRSINDVLPINPPGDATTQYEISLLNPDGSPVNIYRLAFTVNNFTIPSPPSNVIVAAGAGNALVSWTRPEFLAGNADLSSPVSRYTVISSPDGVAVTTNDTSATVTGLTDGTPYTFTVSYTYGVEAIRLYTSMSSHPSRIVTPGPPYPATAPTAPTVFLLPGGSVLLSWAAPIETGNTTLTGYQVARVVDGSNNPITTNIEYNGTTNGATATVTGLTDRATYAFTVAAVNIAGVGSYSAASITVPITSAVAGIYSDISSGSTADFTSAIQAAAVNDPAQALIDGLAAIRFGITSLSLTLVQQSALTAALAAALTATSGGSAVTIPISDPTAITGLMQSVTTTSRVLASLPTLAIVPVYSSDAATFDLSSNCTINGQSMTYAQALQNREAYFIFILPVASHQLTLTYNSASTTLRYTGDAVMNNGTALNANQSFLLGGLSIPLLGLGPLGLGSSSNDTVISVFNVSATWKAPYVYETEQAATSFDLLLQTRESHATIRLLDPSQNILSSGSNSVSLSPSLFIGSNVFAIAVTAQDGTVQNYSLTVVVPPLSNDTSLRIVVAGVPASYNSVTKSFSVYVGPELSSAAFSITANESHAIASVGDLSGNRIQGVWSPISNGATVYSIQSVARDGTVAHYPLTVTNILSPDTSLQVFNVGSVPVGASGLTYTWNEWSSTAVELFIEIRTTEPHAGINGLGFSGTFDVSGQLTFPVGTTSQSFTVTAHDGTQATYTFIVIVGPPILITQTMVDNPAFSLQDGTSYELAENLIMTAPFRFAQFGQPDDTRIVVNGAGYTINVTDNSAWLGLFNKFVTVKNLGVLSTNSVLQGSSGWVFAANAGGRAINCYSTGEIPGGAGGIFGIYSTGTAEICFSTGTIGNGGGGIFAPYSSGTATNCYSTGAIGMFGGGIFGQGCAGLAENCYSTNSIAAYAGGIFGAQSNGTARNCYSIGPTEVFGNFILGLNSPGSAPNCYATGGGPWSDTLANQVLKGFPGDIPRVWFSASPDTPYQLLANHSPISDASIFSVVVNSTPLTANPATGVYSYNMPETAASVAFNIEAKLPLATVSLGGRSAPGYLSGSLDLSGGSNSFTILVTAETGGEPASYSLVIENSQVVTFSEPSLTKIFGDAPFVLAASSSANTAITYTCSPSDVIDISGSLATILKVGSCTITATAAETTGFLSASAMQEVTVLRPQAPLVINDPGTITLGIAVTFSSTGGSGDGAITYTFNGSGYTNSGATFTFTSNTEGFTLVATKAASGDYAAISASLTLLPANSGSGCFISGTTITGYFGPGGAVTIPENITAIGPDAFAHSGSLPRINSVNFPNSLISIGEDAFSDHAFTSLNIPSSVTHIGNYAFNGCFYLRTVILPSFITRIGRAVFSQCLSLTSIKIPSSVRLIDSEAFYRCVRLTSVTIPSSVTSILHSAFSRTALTSVLLPFSTAIIFNDDNASFDPSVTIRRTDRDNPEYEIVGNTIVSYIGPGGNVTNIPTDPAITTIGPGAFANNTDITAVTIPANFTTISAGAFTGCTALASVIFPAGLTTIGESAFDGCPLSFIKFKTGTSVNIANLAFRSITQTVVRLPPGSTWVPYSTTSGSFPQGCTVVANLGSIQSQTVTFSLSSLTKTFGDASFDLAAVTTGDGAITYTCSPSDVLNISGSRATILKAGSCTVTATAAETASYLSASATQVVTVNKAAQVITWNAPYTAPLSKTMGDAAFDLSGAALTTGDGAIRYTSSNTGVVSITGSVATVVGAGSCIITATAAATLNYAEGSASLDVTVTTPSITWDAPFDAPTYTVELGAAPITLSATASNSAPVTYSYTLTSGVAIDISGTVVTAKGVSQGQIVASTANGGASSSLTYIVSAPPTVASLLINPMGDPVAVAVASNAVLAAAAQPTPEALNALVAANVATAASPAAAYTALNQAAVANKSLLTDPDASVLFYNATKAALDPTGTSQSLVFDIASMPIDTTNFLRVAANVATAGITSTKISYPNFTNGSVTIDLPDVMDPTIAYLNKCPIGYSIIYRHGGVPHTVTNRADGLYLDNSTTPYVLGTPIAFDGTFTYTIWAEGSNQGSGNNGIVSDFVISEKILIRYTGSGGDIAIPDSVTAIGERAFFENSGLTSVIIPSSVTSIGERAFQNCTSLTSVTIPSSVTSIGERAFYSCISLTSVTIPSSVTSIGNSAFANCTSLTSVTIPSYVTVIGAATFASCTSLTSVTIPSSVTSIGDAAFDRCTSLTSVTIPSSVTVIGSAAFANCTHLTSITLPPSITSIAESLFYHCSSLPSINIPSGVTSIGVAAFASCSSLTSVTIPSSVTSIGVAAFDNCSSLTSVTIPSSVTSIGASAFNSAVTIHRTQAPLVINDPGTITLGVPVTFSCTGGSGDGAITYTFSGPSNSYTRSGATFTFTSNPAGSTLVATKAASGDYAAISASLTMRPANSGGGGGGPSGGGTLGNGTTPQATLVITPFGNLQIGGALVQLECSGGSGSGAITYTCSPSGILKITGSIANIIGAGNATLTATKAGDSTYASAVATYSFTVSMPSTVTPDKLMDLANNGATQETLNTVVANSFSSAITIAARIANYDAINRQAIANTIDGGDLETSVRFYNAMKLALDPDGNREIEMITANASYINTTNFLRVADPSKISRLITKTFLSFPNFTDGRAVVDLPAPSNTVARLYKCPVGYSIEYRYGGASRIVFNRADGLYLVVDGAETPYELGTAIRFPGTGFIYKILAQGSMHGLGEEAEAAVPCFTKGTMIRVPSGEVAVETLKAGDLVTTADGRVVPVKGLYKTQVRATTAETAPYLIPAGTFGFSAQPRDLLLSPKHAIQIRKGVWNFPGFATRTNPAIRQIAVGEAVDYYHLECPVFLRDNLIANGCAVESFGTLQIKHNPYTYSARLGGFTRQGSVATKHASL